MHTWPLSLNDISLIILGSTVIAYGIFAYVMGLGDVADRRTVENTATSKCRSLALGTVEVAGTVTGPKPFPSLIAHIPCFVSRVVLQEQATRGDYGSWVTLHRSEFRIPFYVQDESGKVKVDPHNAVLQLRPDVEYADESADYAPHALDLAIEQGPTTGLDLLREYCELRGLAVGPGVRCTESNLSPGDPVYVFGTAVAGNDVGDPSEPVVIRKTMWQPLYISESSEYEALQNLGERIVRRLLIGPACITFGIGILASVLARTTDSAQVSLWGGLRFTATGAAMSALLGVIVVGLLVYAVLIFNGLVSLRNEVQRSWANVDVLLKQRFDVVPNLVETCKGYMEHERELLTRIAASHSSWTAAASLDGKVRAASDSGQALQRLLLVAEAYPTLRANETFAQLQNFLTDIEAQIADRRELYNNAVGLLNTRVKQIPDRLVAGLLGYATLPFFAAPSASEAPAVAFAGKRS